jgi:hypothetical protein
MKGHAAMITRLDESVGRLLDKLDEHGIADNTLVLFTSDNGPHREGGFDPQFNDSNGPLRGIKRDLYEGGIRVPLLARWPGKLPAGSTNDHVGAFWDFLATFADLAGAGAPPDTDGISIAPTLSGNAADQQNHEFLYWEFHEGEASKQGGGSGRRTVGRGPERGAFRARGSKRAVVRRGGFATSGRGAARGGPRHRRRWRGNGRSGRLAIRAGSRVGRFEMCARGGRSGRRSKS